jgi:16S rRNA (cytosine967-C5)-methyltransferase
MLAHLATVVRPGGRLIYSTCSSEPEENEQVVSRFLESHPRFRLATPEAFARDAHLSGLLDPDGALKTLPFRDGLEAFYAACLVAEVC